MRLKVLDLFSGIGGFSLGLERAGMETVAFCEQDGYACRVLRKNWPTLPIFEDVRTLTKKRLMAHGIAPEIICGGFPCQDISNAGKRCGIDGERSGLWREYARLIREVQPLYAIMENVAVLRSRGLDRVLGDLSAIGYDAEWHCLPASHVGAPHSRDRIWIVAYPRNRGESVSLLAPIGRDLGHHQQTEQPIGWNALSYKRSPAFYRNTKVGPPRLLRVDDGLPFWMDRLRCLGNAVVPQLVELIGRAVLLDHSRRAVAA